MSATPHSGLLAVELAHLRWRRIQLLVGLRLTADGPAPASLRLLAEDGRQVSVPVGWSTADGITTVRFNTMLGPGAMPLARGRWTLVAGPAGAAPTPVEVTVPAGASVAATAVFRLEEGDYTASADVAPSGRLVLAVDLAPYSGSHAAPDPDETEDGDEDDAPGGGGAGVPADRGTPSRRTMGRLARSAAGPAMALRRVMLRGARAVRARVFRLTIVGATRLPRRGRPVILFTSDSRAELGGNLKLIHDRMLERGVHERYRIKTIFRPAGTTHRPVQDRIRLPLLLGRADTIVVDDFQPVIYWVPQERHRIVQVWHAVGAFKMVGYSRVGRPGAPTPYGRAHKNYSLVTVSATSDIEVYAEAFGIPERNVRATGVPRVDRFFDPAYAARARELVLAAHPGIRGRRTILFAPTFRGHGARSATYDLARLDLAAIHALCVELDAVFIIRLHPFVMERPRIPAELADRVIDGSGTGLDINDLLFAVDLLITDYSSVIYEYSIFGRPALFYAWDLDEYVSSRDFYEPYESFVPGRIVRTCEELVDAIRRGDFEAEKMAGFADRHFDHRDAGSTDRVVDAILEG